VVTVCDIWHKPSLYPVPQNLLHETESVNLSSRFNAHLTFNILNAIQGIILEEDKEEAFELIGSYSRLLRKMLINGSVHTSMSDELDTIKDYLDIERIRRNYNFNYYISVPRSLRETTIPKSLLISIIENAVKHGVRLMDQNGFIQIDVPDSKIIRIKNNAPYQPDSLQSGTGLMLTEDLINRYNNLTGSSLSFKINFCQSKKIPSQSIFEALVRL
jgi:two-component system, LytTR family, sensor kinase